MHHDHGHGKKRAEPENEEQKAGQSEAKREKLSPEERSRSGDSDAETKQKQPDGKQPLSKPSFDVTGKNFIVTGGGQGLGRNIAECLAAQGAAGVLITCRSEEQGEKVKSYINSTNTNCQAEWMVADVAAEAQCAALVRRALGRFGALHGLVNAAGLTTRGTLESTDEATFDALLATNLKGPFFLTKHAARAMRDTAGASGGSVVNISSIASHAGAPFISCYSVTKAALNAMTKVHALELQRDRVRVNALAIGWTLTDNEHKIQLVERGPDWLEKGDAAHPFGRILRPVDVAAAAGFLLSDAALMISGAVLDQHPDFVNGQFAGVLP